MPLYEFECRRCGHKFETLVRDANPPWCPACESHDLKRLLSMFAVDSASTRTSARNEARRQSSNLQREKRIAEHEEAHHHHD